MPKSMSKRFLAAAHRKLALAVVAVAAAAAFVLGAAWRDLGHEAMAALAARDGLAPARLAAHTQQALAAHRPVAAATLAGRLIDDTERLDRQRAVDDHLAPLALALEQRRLTRALTESDQLGQDWRGLLEDIGARRITPAGSDAQHQLLIEQTFVVADLAAADSRLHSLVDRAVDGPSLALATRDLPRLALAAAQSTAGAAAGGPIPAALERRIARAVARVLAAGAQRPLDVDELQALLALQRLLGAATADIDPSATQAEPAAGAGPADRGEPLRRAALQASSAVLARIDHDLVAAAQALAAERRLVGAVLALDVALVLMAALLVAVRIPRRAAVGHESLGSESPSPLNDAAPADPGATAGERPAESEAAANALLHRLRQPALGADTANGALGPR